MSHTNSTANYHLSQYVGSDKPTWLTDYNADMLAIDTQMKANNTAAVTAGTAATTAGTNIGTLANLTTDAKTNLVLAINEVDAHADTAQATANTATTTANAASTKATALEAALNLGNPTNITWTSNLGTITNVSTKIVKNSDGSIAKIYGSLRISNASSSTNVVLTSSDTGLRPTAPITFQSCGFYHENQNFNVSGYSLTIPGFQELEYTLGTNGVLTATLHNATSIIRHDVDFLACVLFIKDFGD